MNLNDAKYNQFSLVHEMLQTQNVVKNIDIQQVVDCAKHVTQNKIFFTGEGSSRIFPAKKTMYDALKNNYEQTFSTESATQALEYQLANHAVFVSSNSGKTKEGVRLIRHLKTHGHPTIIGLVSKAGTPICTESDYGYTLSCGAEKAVAATKSVIEQTLFFDLIFRKLNDRPLPDLAKLGDLIAQVLEMDVPEEVYGPLVEAHTLYFSGRNTGVAEELTLKANEITRKKSDFLEGTYAVHGIEEVMESNEAVIIIDPFPQEEEKFTDVLIKGAHLPVVAIATRKTSFPTVVIPEYGDFTNYLEMAAGWSLLVEIGIRCDIQLDQPTRARKVGNELLE